ncbi:MAG: VWA domain-containing protein, partial [Gammaproteobacteria bacterium]|nr:VWA domain-containing protein [Gammaproteobacteria bacterium]
MVLSRRLTAWNRAGFFALLFGLITTDALFFKRLSFAANEDKPVADVRIVVDISGSMRKNDPHNLRIPAAELLIDLLPDNSKAGLWTFGKYVNMLVKHDYVSADWKRNAKIKAKKINSIAMYTNIGEAVEVASVGWLEPDPRYERSIILLTDGKVDISKSPTQNENEQNRILEQIIPRLTSSKVKVHTIALSANSDQLLMKRLAMNTGGSFSVANSANDLMKIFLKAFDAAVPSEQVPLEGNKFSIDASVKEFTALIFRASKAKPTQLTSPDGVSFNRNT